MLLSILGYFKVSQISNRRIKNFLLFFGDLNLSSACCIQCFWCMVGWGSFGPRFLTGMLPVLAIFLGLFIKDINLNIKSRKNLVIDLHFIYSVNLVGLCAVCWCLLLS